VKVQLPIQIWIQKIPLSAHGTSYFEIESIDSDLFGTIIGVSGI
jgi:hypothetical protein